MAASSLELAAQAAIDKPIEDQTLAPASQNSNSLHDRVLEYSQEELLAQDQELHQAMSHQLAEWTNVDFTFDDPVTQPYAAATRTAVYDRQILSSFTSPAHDPQLSRSQDAGPKVEPKVDFNCSPGALLRIRQMPFSLPTVPSAAATKSYETLPAKTTFVQLIKSLSNEDNRPRNCAIWSANKVDRHTVEDKDVWSTPYRRQPAFLKIVRKERLPLLLREFELHAQAMQAMGRLKDKYVCRPRICGLLEVWQAEECVWSPIEFGCMMLWLHQPLQEYLDEHLDRLNIGMSASSDEVSHIKRVFEEVYKMITTFHMTGLAHGNLTIGNCLARQNFEGGIRYTTGLPALIDLEDCYKYITQGSEKLEVSLPGDPEYMSLLALQLYVKKRCEEEKAQLMVEWNCQSEEGVLQLSFLPQLDDTITIRTLEFWGIGVGLFKTLQSAKNKMFGTQDRYALTSSRDYEDIARYFDRKYTPRNLGELADLMYRITERHNKVLEERIYTKYLGEAFSEFFPMLDFFLSYKHVDQLNDRFDDWLGEELKRCQTILRNERGHPNHA